MRDELSNHAIVSGQRISINDYRRKTGEDQPKASPRPLSQGFQRKTHINLSGFRQRAIGNGPSNQFFTNHCSRHPCTNELDAESWFVHGWDEPAGPKACLEGGHFVEELPMIRGTPPIRRQIRLTEAEYGQTDPQTFSVPWELWAQLRMMSGEKGIFDTAMTDEETWSMANWIDDQQSACVTASAQPTEAWSPELRQKATSWGAHRYLWGDGDGKTVEQLAAFLRGGAVTIVTES